MRMLASLFRVLVLVLVVGFTVHIGTLVLDLWNENQIVNSSKYRALNTNCTEGMTCGEPIGQNSIRNHEHIQSSWKEHVKESCETLGIESYLENLSRDMLYKSKILVDDKHKILFCQIAKVASTTWRRIFIMLSGKVNVTNPMTISANDAHHKYDQHLTYLSDLPKDEILHKLKTYFKFVFVREPFGRLLSAFRNKFVVHTNASSYFRYIFGRKIIKRYRPRPPVKNNGGDVQFQEFVNYLIDSKRKISMNEHWEKFYNLCHPCSISYDFVGKLETFSEDSQYILDKNSLSTKVKIPSRSESKYAHAETNSYLSDYYSQLSTDSLRQLYKNYFGDFLIFNYSVPDVIKYLM